MYTSTVAAIYAVFDDTGTSFASSFYPLAGSRRRTQFPRRREFHPSDFLRSRAHGKDSVFPDTNYKPYTTSLSRFLPSQFLRTAPSLLPDSFFFFLFLFFFFSQWQRSKLPVTIFTYSLFNWNNRNTGTRLITLGRRGRLDTPMCR